MSQIARAIGSGLGLALLTSPLVYHGVLAAVGSDITLGEALLLALAGGVTGVLHTVAFAYGLPVAAVAGLLFWLASVPVEVRRP